MSNTKVSQSENLTWFLRFYGRSDDDIRKCIDEIGQHCKFVGYRIRDAKISCNLLVPAEYKPVREARLYFQDEVELNNVMSDTVKEIYHRWSMKDPIAAGAEPIIRKPKDMAWGV